MEQVPDVSVVISTYNRCEILPRALESLAAQETPGFSFEVVVVDNNSTDRTAEVIEDFVARHPFFRHVFEGRQGLSHGWNAGVARSRAPVIAFTDDDLVMPPDWLANIKRAFDGHPEVSFIGSRVLPLWEEAEPPAWLSRQLWAPLALQDSEEVFYTDESRPVCLIGKSFRREALDAVGGFRPDLGRVKDAVGSTEDDEMQRRIRATGRRGMHVPSVVVHAPVPASRLTKSYFRRWHTGHGRHYALMRVPEVEDSAVRFFDVPAYMFRQAVGYALGWAWHAARGRAASAFERESQLRFLAGFFRQRRADYRAAGGRGTLGEFLSFTRSIVSSKLLRRT